MVERRAWRKKLPTAKAKTRAIAMLSTTHKFVQLVFVVVVVVVMIVCQFQSECLLAFCRPLHVHRGISHHLTKGF